MLNIFLSNQPFEDYYY